MILDVDLSQIEWRAAADLSQDPVMIKEIKEGIDQHAATCTDQMELQLTDENRTTAKIFNFRYIYCDPNSAPFAYYMDSKMPDFSKKKWEDIIERMVLKYNGLAQWHKEIIKEVRKTGQLAGPLGHIWEFQKQDKGGYKDYNTHQIRNYPVQGIAGALIKLALCVIQKRAAHLEKQFVNSVHDSLIYDVPERNVRELATICLATFSDLPDLVKKYFGYQISVPISGEAAWGHTWGEPIEEMTL